MLLKQSLAYGASRGLAAVFALVAIAVFSRILTPAQYGDYALLLATGTLLSVICFQWIRVSALRFLPHYEQERDRVFVTLFGAFVGVSVALIGLGVLILPLVRPSVVVTAVVLAIALGWFELEQDIARSNFLPWQYGQLAVSRAALGLGIGYGLIEAGLGGFGPVVGMAIAMVLSTMLFSRNQLWGNPARVSKPMLGRFLGYGGPLVVAYALDFVVSTSDRFLLVWLSTKEATGLYSAGYDLAFRTVGFATVVVGLAALPLAVERFEAEGVVAARAQLAKNRDALLAITVPVVVVVALFATNIGGVVLGGEFSDKAGSVIPLIAVSTGLLAIKSYYADHAIHLEGRTGLLALVTATAAVVNVAVNLWLIPSYGEIGAAISTFVAYSVGLVGALWVAHRLFGLPRLSKDTMRVVFSGLVVLLVGWQFRDSEGAMVLAGQVALCASVYSAALLASDFAESRSRLLGFVGLKRR